MWVDGGGRERGGWGWVEEREGLWLVGGRERKRLCVCVCVGGGGEPQSYIHDKIERMSVCVGGICWG